MEYNWEDIYQRCEKYVLFCKNELPTDFEDKLINDVYCHLIIDKKKKELEEEGETNLSPRLSDGKF